MRHWRTTGNGNMGVKPENTYRSLTDRPYHRKSNGIRFSTTASSNKLFLGDCDNDRQPEMAIAVFSAILPLPTVHRWHLLQSLGDNFIGARRGICRWNFGAVCHSSKDIFLHGFGFGGHIVIFGCRLLLQSFVDTFCSSTCMFINPGFAVRISDFSVCHSFTDVSISGFAGYFWLSVVFGIACVWRYFLRASRGRKL